MLKGLVRPDNPHGIGVGKIAFTPSLFRILFLIKLFSVEAGSMPLPNTTDDIADTATSRRRGLALYQRVLAYALVGLLLYVAVIWAMQRKLIFPTHVLSLGLSNVPSWVEPLKIDTPAGQSEAWLVLPSAVAGSTGQEALPSDGAWPLVIFAHGNAERIDDNTDFARGYLSMGVAVLMPEYRGYGRSDGKPSQAALTSDFMAFYDLAAARQDIDAQRIVLHGRSLGGGVVAQLAAQKPTRGLILESTFTSVTDVAKSRGIVPWLIRDPFNTLAVLPHYAQPVLVMHGTTDHIIPPTHADRLAAASKDVRLVKFDGHSHNDPPPADAYWGAIEGLLDDARLLAGQ